MTMTRAKQLNAVNFVAFVSKMQTTKIGCLIWVLLRKTR